MISEASAVASIASNPDFLGAIAGGAIGLIGALIGGFLSYYGVMRQYKLASEEKRRDLLAAVLLEICRNHSGLVPDLDAALPDWLARSHRFTNQSRDAEIKERVSIGARSSTNVYDRLFVDLMRRNSGWIFNPTTAG